MRSACLAALTGVLGTAVLLNSRAWSTERPLAPAAGAPALAATAREALAQSEALADGAPGDSRSGRFVGLDMPKGPLPSQQRVDSRGKCPGRAQTPINGGCWVLLGTLKPPCGDEGYEWKGGCYWVMLKEEQEATSTLPPYQVSPGLALHQYEQRASRGSASTSAARW